MTCGDPMRVFAKVLSSRCRRAEASSKRRSHAVRRCVCLRPWVRLCMRDLVGRLRRARGEIEACEG